MKKNRATLIIVIVVALVLVGLALFYFLFMRGTTLNQPGNTGPNGFPVGQNTAGGTSGGTTGGTSGGTGTQQVGTTGFQNQPQTFQQLRELSSLPVAGGTLFAKNADTVARYIERGTGHIYEAPLSQSAAPYRISNTTIPKIYEAQWTQNGQGFLIRYLSDGSDAVRTFYAALTPSATSTGAQLTNGTFLSGNITALAVAPRQDRIFYLVESGGQTFGIKANPDGTRKTQLFSSTANEWQVTWPTNTTVAIATKPSSGVGGYLYFLDSTSGALTKILNNVKGLTALVSPDGSQVLYSDTSTGLSLKTFNRALQQTSDIGLRTLPEKCVWSVAQKGILYCAVPDNLPVASYPDSWYQGTVSFTDNLWRINLKTGETKMILTPQSVAQQTMDIINPSLDPQEHYLLFMNKKDLSLWVLNLGQPATGQTTGH